MDFHTWNPAQTAGGRALTVEGEEAASDEPWLDDVAPNMAALGGSGTRLLDKGSALMYAG